MIAAVGTTLVGVIGRAADAAPPAWLASARCRSIPRQCSPPRCIPPRSRRRCSTASSS